MQITSGIKPSEMNYKMSTFTDDIAERVKLHKQNYFNIIYSRYVEFLPLLISYENYDLDSLLIESYLRAGYGVAIGETKTGKIDVLGYCSVNTNYLQPIKEPLQGKDITFIHNNILPKGKYKELTRYSDGNFVVLRNKRASFLSDYNIITHYVMEMSEIANSRYSISIQAKVNTFIRNEGGSKDGQVMANNLFNGVPYTATTPKFDPEEHILTFNNASAVSFLPELKREQQNKISELNAMLGLNTLGVDKESGVSEIEAQSNTAFKKANENIYLGIRNEALNLINNKYGLNIHAEYRDNMVAELSSIEKLQLVSEVAQ